MKTVLSAIAIIVLISTQVSAAPEIPFGFFVTEVWSGNDPGSNLTEDWFEITNLGDESYTASLGDLYFDDESNDPNQAVQLLGITSVALGESVIFVDGGAAGAAEWISVWEPVLDSLPQVGYYEGDDLDQDGDTVVVFFDADVNGPDEFDDLAALETYPDATLFGGRSYDGFFSKFTNAFYGVTTTAVNDEGQPAIGTPGTYPEPTTAILVALGGLCFATLRSRAE